MRYYGVGGLLPILVALQYVDGADGENASDIIFPLLY